MTEISLAGVRTRVPPLLINITSASSATWITPTTLPLIVQWIDDAAQSVTTYYRRFPVPQARVSVAVVDGRGAQSGTTGGASVPTINMSVGRATLVRDLQGDWMMTHEMVHLAFPRVPAAHHWIEEGLATYVEPIARAQAGKLTSERVWHDLVKGLPHGLPRVGDRGLDYAKTWGRVYWGGALYCLLADIEIRRRTGNRFGLQDALQGVLAAGGNIEAVWSLRRALRTADDAVGVPVMTELYERMGNAAVEVDLDTLWQELGVSVIDGVVQFDEAAPLAPIRRAITSPPVTA